ncbi:ABC transporter permease [Amycolatopsis sp. NPDC049253]|uniref:ABC transporter permease n=1 Tax=Amycolatopsis sp. NPDC049253 TaxID=3155274 RepID=UPI0034225724
MTRFLLRRVGAAAVLLVVLSALIFALDQISPGDKARAYVGGNASPAAVAAARHQLGLDQPWPQQYLRYLWNAVHGDLGASLRTHRPVTTDLGQFLPATAELVLFSFVLAVLLALLFALSGALRWPGTGLYRGVLLLGATAPAFLLGLGGIVLFYGRLHWLPEAGRGVDTSSPTGFVLLDSLLHGDGTGFVVGLRHLLLPGLALAIAPAISIGRILRSGLESVYGADHVRTARAKGIRESGVLCRHVVRNSLDAALSMSGLQLGFMFAGVVIVEDVFAWPGVGYYLAQSIPQSDFPAIAGVTLLLGGVYIVVNAVVDVLQAAADPRLTV